MESHDGNVFIYVKNNAKMFEIINKNVEKLSKILAKNEITQVHASL